MTNQPTAETEPTDLRMALIELRHLRAEVARLRPYVAVADGASRAAEHWEAETKRWLAFIERGMETHMRFGVIRPDGRREELPCADWCYACRLENGDAFKAAVAGLIAEHEGDEWASHSATTALRALFSGSAATEATEPVSSPARNLIAAVIRDFPFDNYGLDNISYALEADPDAQEWVPVLATAVLDAVLPPFRITAGLARDSEATVQRVIDLYARWRKAGPPPLGVPLARWWDARLIELHNAILPPTDQTTEN